MLLILVLPSPTDGCGETHIRRYTTGLANQPQQSSVPPRESGEKHTHTPKAVPPSELRQWGRKESERSAGWLRVVEERDPGKACMHEAVPPRAVRPVSGEGQLGAM